LAYAYITGGVVTAPTPAATPITNYWLDASGGVHQMAVSDNVKGSAHTFPGDTAFSGSDQTTLQNNYPDDWADYSIPLSLTAPNVIDLSGINATNMPDLGVGTNAFSGRIYISLGVLRLPFTVQAADATSPNPYANPSQDLNAVGSYCLYDWFEFSITGPGPSTPAGILDGNSTQVDQFGLPLTIDSTPGGSTQGTLNLSRNNLLTQVNALPAPLNGMLTIPVPSVSAAALAAAYPAGTQYLRALSPDHISSLSGGSNAFQTYFDGIISTQYAAWAATPLVVTDTATNTYSGMVVGGNLIFISGNYTTQSDWNTAYQATTSASQINFGVLTTAIVWQCNGSFASGSTAQKNIGKQILAAFNRGVFNANPAPTSLDDGSCPSPSQYYQSQPCNEWANQFHIWNTNKLAYGFAYDDICKQSSSQNTSGPLTALNITLGQWS